MDARFWPWRAISRGRGLSFELHYCTRSPEKTAFKDAIGSDDLKSSVTVHHDGGNPADGLDIAGMLKEVRQGANVYYCGPHGLHACLRGRRPNTGRWGTVHREFFNVDPDVEFGDDTAFKVIIASTGQELDVPADKSIVDVLRANGIEVETMCEEGICGTLPRRCFWKAIPTTATSCSTTKKRHAASSSWSAAGRAKSPTPEAGSLTR